MEQIRISLEEVSQTATNLRVCNANLEDVLDYVYHLMNELSSVWSSQGSMELIGRFNSFATRFKDERETIESYARFLDFTVSSYQANESSITANAANFN